MIPDIQQFIASSCVTIQGCIQAIYNLIVALAVVIAFIMFFIGAFKNLLSVVPDIKMEGKRQMRNSIIGLIVIFSSGVLLYWINPEIFNARLIMFKIINIQLPSINVAVTTTTINYLDYTISVTGIPQEEINQLQQRECKSKNYLVRLTTYYIPFYEDTYNWHKFSSDVTLQGTGLFGSAGTKKVLNALDGIQILNESKKSGEELDKCRYGWKWTWIKVTGNPPHNCPAAMSSQKESIKNKDVLDENKAITTADSVGKSFTGKIYGSYGPLIPLITVAHNRNDMVFNAFDILKVLACNKKDGTQISCNPNFSKILIVTDTGGGLKNGADAWLDLFAGFGKGDLNNATSIKPSYITVCKIGKVNLK